ncbi:MAG: DUF1080 domain-containing protein, partial [Pirellulales bacterium]
MRNCLVLSLATAALLMTPAVRTRADEPTALFNGRDLAGWTYYLKQPDVPMEDVWSVKDGVIVCQGKPAGYLLTKKNDYENYVLTFEWRWPEKGGNSGALVHVTTPRELDVWPKCLEVQLGNGDGSFTDRVDYAV